MKARIEIEMGKEQAARKMLSRALDTYRRLGVEFRIQEIEGLLSGLSEPKNTAEQVETVSR